MGLSKLKPAVPTYWMIALAGLMWSAVGIMLCRFAYIWLTAIPWNRTLVLALAGILSALAAYRFGFSRIARKNIVRLNHFSEKGCIFAFQAWRSYIMIGIMIVLGIILRHSPLPKHYLAVIYATMGGALLLGSLHYYGRLYQMVRRKP